MKTTQTNNKTTLMRVLVLVILLVAGVNKSAWGQIRTATGGNWNNASTWGGSTPPDETSMVNIPNGIIVTISSADAFAKQIIVNGTLNLNTNRTLSIGNTSATASGGMDFIVNAGGTFTAGINSTVAFVNAGTTVVQEINGNVTFHNLTINQGNATKTVRIGAASSGTVNGNLTITQGIFDVQDATFNVNTTNISANGTFTDTGAAGTNTFNGAVTVATGGNFTQLIANTSSYVFKGNIVNGGTLDLNGTGTITFSPTTAPLLITNNGSSINFLMPATASGNTTLRGANSMNFNAFTVGAGVTVTNENTSGVIFNGTLNGAATNSTFTNGTGAGNAAKVSIRSTVVPMVLGQFTVNAVDNTVTYDGANQDVRNNTPYHHLIIAGTNTKSLIAAITVNGDLTINTGSTLNSSGFNIAIKGNWTRTGGFNAGTGTATVTFNGATAQTITGNTTFNNLTIANTATTPNNTVTSSSVITVNDITFTSGVLNVDNGNSSMNVKGDFINNSIAMATPTIVAAYVRFDGTGTQNISGSQQINFGGLEIANTGVGVTLVRDINVRSYFRMLTGNTGTFNAGTFNINVSGNGGGVSSWSKEVTSGVFNAGAGTVSFTGAGAQTITGNTTFNNLTIAKTGATPTVTLSTTTTTNIIVTNTLTLTSGRIVLGNNNITFNMEVGSGNVNGGWVETNGSGALIKSSIPTAGGAAFPVGDASARRIANLNASSNPISASTSVRFVPPTPPTPAGSTDVAVGIWVIIGMGTSNIEFVNAGSVNTASKIHKSAGVPSATTWIPLTTTPPPIGFSTGSTPATYVTQVLGGTNFTIFTPAALPTIFYSNTPLPSGGNWNVNTSWSSTPTPTVTAVAISPPVGATVIIQAGHTTTLTANASIADITVNGTVNLGTNTLTITGNLVYNGAFAGSTGGVLMSSPNAQSITTSASGTTFTNLSFAGAGAKTITGGGFTVNNFSLDACTVNANITNITVGGNFNFNATAPDNATFNAGTGNTVLFSGLTRNIAITGSGTINPDFDNLTIGISSGLAITGNSNANINIKGNWTNNDTFTAGTQAQTVTFNGTGANAQLINGSSITTFNNLTIDKIGANNIVTMGKNVTVSNTLALTNGKLSTDGLYEIKLTGLLANQLSGANANNYVVLGKNGANFGKMSRDGLTSVAPILFPVGTSDYTPVNITTAGSASVQLFESSATSTPAITSPEYVNRIWNVSTSANATVQFNWNAANSTLPPFPNNAQVYRFNTAWTPIIAPVVTTITATSTTVNNIVTNTQFAVFATPAPVAPLNVPNADIKFLPITIDNLSNKVTFSWIGVPNAISYEVRIGKVEANNVLVWKTPILVLAPTLSYVNNNIEYDVTTYYSVRAIGATPAITSAWSSFVNVFVSSINNPATSLGNSLDNMIKVSPNPSNGDFIVDFGGINVAKSLVRVYNAQGKEIFMTENNNQINSNQMVISLVNAANGIYLLQISTEKGNIQRKIVKAD